MRRSCTVADAAAVAAEVRATVPAAASVADVVAAIVEDVRLRGNAAVAEYEAAVRRRASGGGSRRSGWTRRWRRSIPRCGGR